MARQRVSQVSWDAGEVVPLAERIMYMQVFRAAAAATAIGYVLAVPAAIGIPYPRYAVATAGYLIVSLLAGLAWRFARRRGLPLFGLMLVLDGGWLAGVVWATGGTMSPLVGLVLLHLVGVALLASYRTGVKLALWHSLLLLLVTELVRGRVLRDVVAVPGLPGSVRDRLVATIAVYWLVALGTASCSALNERELRRRRYDLEALTAMARRLEEVADERGVAEVLVDSVADAFGFDRALVIATTDDGVLPLAGCGEVRQVDGEPHHLAPGSVLELVAERRRTLLEAELDLATDAWLSSLLPSARNLVVVPLTADGGVVAVLVAEHALRSDSRIERRVVSMLERFGSHAALALVNARLLERMAVMASTDGLTALANRRTFDEVLARELARGARTGGPTSLVLLDIDFFKRLNDEHGHHVGDDVLRAVAAVVDGQSREYDVAARYGGEEFAVVLPATHIAAATEIGERLRRAVAEAPLSVSVTVSVGVATLVGMGPVAADGTGTGTGSGTPRALLAAADAALYDSKRGGRDRVTAAAELAPPRLALA